MINTIKTKKQMTFRELIEYILDNNIKYKYFDSIHDNLNQRIYVKENGVIFFASHLDYNTGEIYEVEVEEEVTEDTLFDHLIFVFKETGSFYINSKRCASVGEIVRYLNCDEVNHIYIMNPDGTIGDLIWTNGEMVE